MKARDALLDDYVRTGHFRFGIPRDWTLSKDGRHALFIRTPHGAEESAFLWRLDLQTGDELVLASPDMVDPDNSQSVLDAEDSLRKHSRHRNTGVTRYSTDAAGSLATFAVNGILAVVDVADTRLTTYPELGRVFDPRLSPDGDHIAFCSDGAVSVFNMGTGSRVELASDPSTTVTFGLPDLVAAEELGRSRGHWWSPSGDALLVSRVDTACLEPWRSDNPFDPAADPSWTPFPRAGGPNADVSLLLVDVCSRETTPIVWDREGFEYLLRVGWLDGRPLLTVQSRDQKHVQVICVDPDTGHTDVELRESDPSWVHVAPGAPRITADGRLVWVTNQDDTYRLSVDGDLVTPPGLQVRSVIGVDGDAVVFTASDFPPRINVFEWSESAGVHRLTDDSGVWAGHASSCGQRVLVGQTLDDQNVVVKILRSGSVIHRANAPTVPSPVKPRVTFLTGGARGLNIGVVLPRDYNVGIDEPLPVLVDSYGGPDGQRVWSMNDKFHLPQWFAEQGFAVVVADGRGSSGRSPGWSRSVAGDIATHMLQDQVDALHHAADALGCLDLSRVGIRGLSFAGYLSLLAVLRRPDVFHAATSIGAPTDMRLYQTYWVERFLGTPEANPRTYDACSLLDDAANLDRPVLMVHGLMDDNVVPAHAFKLSAALFAAGRDHTLLPVPAQHNITSQPELERTVLRMQAEFLRRELSVEDGVAR